VKIRISPEVGKFWDTGIGNGAILRKSLFIKENFWFDEKIMNHEDWDFGVRVLKNHKIESIPEALQIYHHHPVFKKSTLSSFPLGLETIDYLFQKHFSYYQGLGKKPLSVFYHRIGRLCCRAGYIKKGKRLFLKAFLLHSEPGHIIYYLFWSFPKFAQNFYFENLLHRILKFYGKFRRKT